MRAALPVLVLLALLEVGARVSHTVLQDVREMRERRARWYVLSPELGWERRSGFSGDVYESHRTFDDRGYLDVDSSQVEGRQGPRILLLGGSGTFGNGVPAEDMFTEVLEELVPGAVTINLAVPGYTSYQGRVLLEREIEALRPDVVVASFGFNDRRSVLWPDRTDGPEWFREMYVTESAMPWLAYVSYVFRTVRLAARSTLLRRAEGERDLLTLQPRVTLEGYGENLAGIVEIARAHGARSLLLELTDNRVQAAALYRSVDLLAQGRPEEAAAELGPLSETKSPFQLLARKHRAEALAALGREAEATRLRTYEPYHSVHGGSPLFLDEEYFVEMRRVGARLGVAVVDAGTPLRDRSECFLDHCHIDPAGHRIVAELLAEALEGVGS